MLNVQSVTELFGTNLITSITLDQYKMKAVKFIVL